MSTVASWFHRAVFYEVLVHAFADSNGDGIGDLPGLESKLDYLHWLGVDCLWLPPFYPSPMKDGGYDVKDFLNVSPDFGTLEDFESLVAAAHKRGMKIIVDLVMNHTSDQHPWFIQSREDPQGPYGDFYVWNDSDNSYAGTRIIFIDSEISNWSYCEQRGQFYWHRFYSHQPDLNYDNPAVRSAMLDVMRFWLDKGVDGFRLDAVPYLFERHGTNCENLPETHEFLAECHRVIQEEYPGRVLLAEANQWPHEVVEYFGTEEAPECDMCFQFPIMPRLFLSLRTHDVSGIKTIVESTPEIPPFGRWGVFLRNHDELTLEMVTEKERELMYGFYAPQARMRSNVGIRRRLASLLDFDPAQIRLLHALLLLLPGSPVLYYGDEIAMADNIHLHDRNGVRTPMQWNEEGGFSAAKTTYLPMIEGEHGPARVNVDSALANTDSLLHWLRDLIALRRELPGIADNSWDVDSWAKDQVLIVRRPGVVGAFNFSAEPVSIASAAASLTGVTFSECRTVHGCSDAELPGFGYTWRIV